MYRQVDREIGAGGQAPPVPPSLTQSLEFLDFLPDATRDVPRSAMPLFDRGTELEQLNAMLASPDVRLLTISGPGGAGKTRLALETAHRAAAHFPDGVITISLAPIRDPIYVLPAIARGSGVRFTDPGNAEPHLVATFHEQRALLLLDNFEQVIGAADGIARLLAGCPHLKLLVTSRAPLRLSEERVFLAAPLSVGTSPVDVGDQLPGAIQLFATRAAQVDPAFTLGESNIGDIQEICRRLDGLPLAIELAAARIGTVSPRDLLERFDPSLPLLAHGNRDLPERQQTMRAAIAWSYELLPQRERQLLRWLSVFIGGFRLRVAEAFIAQMRVSLAFQPLTGADLVESIGLLVASNLLQKTPGNGHEYRYAMLEVVREYGLELLEQHEELTVAYRAHADWYSSNREWLDPNRFAPGERFIDHLWDIDTEYPNVRAALARSAAHGDAQSVLEIAGNMAVFWHHRGFLGEGRDWLERGLESAPRASAETRAWGLAGLGLIRWTQGAAGEAEPSLQEALAIAIELDHAELQALSLHLLALTDIENGHTAQARQRIETALSLWRALELPSDEAMALLILSSLPPAPSTPDRQIADAQEALALFESIGHTSGVAFVLLRLGRLAQLAGDERRALDFLARSVTAWLSIDERWAIARPILLLAELAMQHDRPREAALLLGVIDHRLRASDATHLLEFRAIQDTVRAALVEALGAATFEKTLQAGTQLATDEIDALASSISVDAFERPLLSQREREVLHRIAEGETDREIAEALFVSPRTINTHVGHILTKLDASSRRMAVKRAQELGLLDPSERTNQ